MLLVFFHVVQKTDGRIYNIICFLSCVSEMLSDSVFTGSKISQKVTILFFCCFS